MGRLEQQMEFLVELDKMKQIGRQTYLADGSRKENDAEHSWHLAMMAPLLSEYANEPVDKLRTISMVLVHDLVEIDAGDTYAYDEAANQTKREREVAAAKRIFSLLPKEQKELLWGLWDEFEENVTPEAKFAHTLDNVQPILLNHMSGGKGWRERGVCRSQIYARNRCSAMGAKALWELAENMIEANVKAGNIKDA